MSKESRHLWDMLIHEGVDIQPFEKALADLDQSERDVQRDCKQAKATKEAIKKRDEEDRKLTKQLRRRGFFKHKGAEVSLVVIDVDGEREVTLQELGVVEVDHRNKFVGWASKKDRDEYKRKLGMNKEDIQKGRHLKRDEHEIYKRLSYPPSMLRGMAAFVYDADMGRLRSLVEHNKETLTESFGKLPLKPQIVPIFQNRSGIQPALSIKWR